MLNKKGMSLIEVVIAIAILSLGAAVMYSGFTTIAKMMVDSKVYTENVNNQLSALNGKKEDEVTLTTSEEETKVTIRFGKKEEDIIVVNSALTVAASVVDTVNTLNLKRLDFDEVEEKSNIDEYLDSLFEFVIKISLMNEAEWRQYMNEYSNKYNYNFSNYSFGNTNIITLHYFDVYGDSAFPAIEQSIIDKCNIIFDEDQQPVNPNTNRGKMRPGDKTYYMHTYFAYPSAMRNYIKGNIGKIKNEVLHKELLDKYLLTFADTKSGLYNSGWDSSLFYKPDEKSWYYKRFPVGSDHDPKGSKYSFSAPFVNNDLSQFYLVDIKIDSEFKKID